MLKKLKEFLIALSPYIFIILLGIAGTELFKASEGIRGSPFINLPGNISHFDEGGHLEMAQRVLRGQVPYRDFWTLYTPLRIYLIAGLMKVFGESVLTERIYFSVFPLLGFISFFLLAKLLTKNIAIAFFTTLLVVAGHTINERNTLFIVTLFLFVKAVPFREKEDLVRENFFSNQFTFLTGISWSLTFLISQEFALYAFVGIIVFLLAFFLLNRLTVKSVLRFLLFYSAGILLIIVPFLLYLIINHAFLDFVQNIFLDFVNGPIAKLWIDPLPNFLFPDFTVLFGENSIIYSLRFLTYAVIFLFLSQLVFSLFFLLRNASHKSWWWVIFFIALFGLINTRGLFYTQSQWRFADIMTFILVLIVLNNMGAFLILKGNKNIFAAVFITLLVTIVDWYVIILVPLREFFNDFSQMVTFSHYPQGVYLDRPRAKIYLIYPNYAEEIQQENLNIEQNTAGLSQYTTYFPLTNWHSRSKTIESGLKQTFQELKFTQQKMSDIENNNKLLQNKFSAMNNEMATATAGLKLLRNDIKAYENQLIEGQDKTLKQKIRLRAIYTYIDNLINAISRLTVYLPETASKNIYKQPQFSYLLEISDFLAKSPGKYAYGMPASAVYLFLADKINPTRFPAVQTNITLADQKIAIRDLEDKKPCRAIRQHMSVQLLDVSEYAPLLWQYLEGNYNVVKNVSGIELMARKSCGQNY